MRFSSVISWLHLVVLFGGWSFPSAAQSPPPDLRVEFVTETRADYIHQDRNGFIWLALNTMVLRYDGATRHVYQHLPFDSTSISNGNYWAIASDRDGGIWLGTATSGVNRMTGYGGRIDRWEAVPDDPNGLTARWVNSLFIDSRDRVWASTVQGLNLFDEDHDRFIHFVNDPSDPKSLPSNAVGGVAEDLDGRIWVGTGAGLAELDRDSATFRPYPFEYRLPGGVRYALGQAYSDDPFRHVKSIYVDASNQIWVVLTSFSFPPPGSAQSPYGVLARFDREDASFEVFDLVENQLLVGLSSIVQDRQGRYWVATEEGLASFDPETSTFTMATLLTNSGESIEEIPITQMIVDRDGAIWIASARGVGRITLGVPGIEVYPTVDAADVRRGETAWVDAVLKSSDGETLWFSSGNEELAPATGLTRLNRSTGKETRYRHDPDDENTLSDNWIRRIVEREDGKLWIGTSYGLNLLDPATDHITRYYIDGDRVTSEPVTMPPQYSRRFPNYINDVDLISDDRLLVATGGIGTAVVDVKRGTITSHIYESPYPEWRGTSGGVLVSSTGLYWTLFAGGVGWMDPGTGRSKAYHNDPNDPTTIIAGELTSIHEDAKGRIWVGSYGGGLSLFEQETESWRHYGIENGLPANNVACITHDGSGHIWVSTFEGVSRFDPESEIFENFWVTDGLQGHRFAGGGCSRNEAGELFFSGEYGFNIIKPREVMRRSKPPAVVLTGFAVSGVRLRPGSDPRLPLPLSETGLIELSHSENSLQFDYSGIDFGRTGARNFEYKLEPLETEWQSAGSRQSASYANLAPGDYTFSARVSVAGHVSPTPASIRILITPPWWASWWAYGLFAVVFLGLLYGGYSLRVRRLKTHSERLEQLIADRTRDLEEEKRKTEKQSARLLELDQAKNRFFANISHEFRTPLTLIVGPLQDAVDGAYRDDPDELRHQHEVMLSNARRLLRLINQLLDLSKLESGKLELDPEPGDILAFLRGLSRRFAPAAERRRISLGFQADRESLPCLFDPDKIEKILSNLVSNALKFTPSGGKVGISVETDVDQASAQITIQVKDTGCGIPPDQIGRIFDRFEQVDSSTTRPHEGTGIGLSLAKELIELHGGTISVESQVDFGTTFIVDLPLTPAPRDAMAETVVEIAEETEPAEFGPDQEDSTANAAPDPDAPVILLVEDNREVREFVKSHLKEAYHIIEADNGEDGLAEARLHRPDLILTDVMMPRMDGYEMVRRIRDIDALEHTPVIMLTAKADEGEAVKGIESGADDYVAKPFSSKELLARISSLIRRRREMRARFSEELVVKGSDVVVTSDDAAFIDSVTSVIDEHLDDANFGADWLAQEVGLSRRQLERRLDDVLGETPATLIRRFRLERASQLLRAEAGTVAEVAYSVGFTNPAYFARAFKKAYGESPSEHRNSGH